MPVFNYPKKEVNVKVVYYGPGLSGKTTNLQKIHDGIKPDYRGKLVSLATQTDRTLFFDFMPLELGSLGGYKVRLHLYTVPGQVHYNATRKLVLKGVDGVVFVADSQRAMNDANIESVLNLEKNLQSYGKSLVDLPHLIQANKRDLDDVISMEEIQSHLNHHGAVVTEAVASEGTGVMETLTGIVRLVMRGLKEQFDAGLQEVPPPAKPQDQHGNEIDKPVLETGPAPETESQNGPDPDAGSSIFEAVEDDAEQDLMMEAASVEPEAESFKAADVEASIESSEIDPSSEPSPAEPGPSGEWAGETAHGRPVTPIRILVPVEGFGTLELSVSITARVLEKGEIKALDVDVTGASLAGGAGPGGLAKSSATGGLAVEEPAEVPAAVHEQGSRSAEVLPGSDTAAEAAKDAGTVDIRSGTGMGPESLAGQDLPVEGPTVPDDLPPLGEPSEEPLGAPLDGQQQDAFEIPDLPQEEEKIIIDEEDGKVPDESPLPDVSPDYDPSVQPLDFDFPETDKEAEEPKKKGFFGRLKKK